MLHLHKMSRIIFQLAETCPNAKVYKKSCTINNFLLKMLVWRKKLNECTSRIKSVRENTTKVYPRCRFIILTCICGKLAKIPKKPRAQFRRWTFHEPNLIHWIKYMKSLASESIRNACFNFERLRCSFHLAQLGISPLEWLWNSFDSDAKLFMYWT